MDASKSPRLWLSDFIAPEAVELNLRGHQRDAVLAELVEHVPEIAGQPDAQQTLLRALQEREQLHSTGIGDGIALPHARSTVAGLVRRPAIIFGRHPQGIPFGAIDGAPVRIFFLLVATEVTQHLQFLARLSRLLRDPRLRQNLLATDKPEKVIALIREAEANF